MIGPIFRGGWSNTDSVITYDKLLLSEGDAGTLDPATGVWTTNVPGLFNFEACFLLFKHICKIKAEVSLTHRHMKISIGKTPWNCSVKKCQLSGIGHYALILKSNVKFVPA